MRFGLVWRKNKATLNIDPGLHQEIKVEAAKRGLKMGVSMPIDEHLMRDEEILATAKDPNAMFYVTSRRVIRHEKSLFKEKVDTIPFPHITAVALESESYWWLAIVGVISIIMGVFVGGTIGIGLALMGVLLIVVGIFAKSSWYQIRGAGMPNEELKRWRLGNVQSPDVKTFARMIEDQITKRR